MALCVSHLVSLVDLLLGCFTEHTLILAVVVEPHHVRLALLLHLVKHLITFTQSVPPLHFLFGLLLAHGGLELIAVGTGLALLLILHLLLLLLVDLLLELDNGAPLIDTTLRILRVVPFIIIGESLQLLTLVLHGLFDALSMHPQRINQVIPHLSFSCTVLSVFSKNNTNNL